MRTRLLKEHEPTGNADTIAMINLIAGDGFDDLETMIERFRDLGCVADAIASEIEDSPEYDDPTQEEIHARFVAEILPTVCEQYEQNGQKDIPARSEAFNNWTDMLCKDGEISDTLYNNIEHPVECD